MKVLRIAIAFPIEVVAVALLFVSAAFVWCANRTIAIATIVKGDPSSPRSPSTKRSVQR